jgi:hypothetical protein
MYYLLELFALGTLSTVIYRYCKKNRKKNRKKNFTKNKFRNNLKYIENDYINSQIIVENLV